MGFWKTLLGGEEPSAEEQKQTAEDKNFDLLKYDGVKAMRIGRADYAVKCLEKALELKEDLEARDYLAQALLQSNRLEDALGQYEHMSEAQPDNAALLRQMAHVAYMLEDYERMAAYCDRALALDGTDTTALYQRAQAYVGQGNEVSAIALLTKTVSLNEQMGDARLLRARLLLKIGDTSSADEDAQWLMEHTDDQEDVLLLKARVEHRKGNADEAIRIYNKVIELNPFCVDAFRERGQIHYERGEMREAEMDMHQVLEIDPQQGADITGEFSAEGVEHKVKQMYRSIDPYGIFG